MDNSSTTEHRLESGPSQSPAPTNIPPSASALHIYAVVVGVGVICAVAIVTVYESTKPIIHRNTIALRKQSVLDVLPEARTTVVFRDNGDGQFEPILDNAFSSESASESKREFVFAGYDVDNRLVGLAIETSGMGYQDEVRILYGYSFEQQAIVGMRVLQSRETPGLGDRVSSDAAFLRNFDALDVRVDPHRHELLHPIEFVKPASKQSDWQVDGISGATITSRAIAQMLHESTQVWVPRVFAHRNDFVAPSQQE